MYARFIRLGGAPAGAMVAALGGGGVLYAEDQRQLRLVSAQVLSRHGARTPIENVEGVPVPADAFPEKPQPVCGAPSLAPRHAVVRPLL